MIFIFITHRSVQLVLKFGIIYWFNLVENAMLHITEPLDRSSNWFFDFACFVSLFASLFFLKSETSFIIYTYINKRCKIKDRS